MTPLGAIRKYCVDCSGSVYEVGKCTVLDCVLYKFRFGRGEGMGSRLRAIRGRCIQCAENVAIIRNCPVGDCLLWEYRMGHNPARSGITGRGNLNISHLSNKTRTH